MKKHANIVKITVGLAVVLVLAIASFNQPNLAVASSTLYNVDAEATPNGLVYGPTVVLGSYEALSHMFGYEEPILLPQVNDKLFDH